VSDSPIQPVSPAARHAASARFGKLSSLILHSLSFLESTKARADCRSSRKAFATIKSHAFKSLEKSQRKNSKPSRVAAAVWVDSPAMLGALAFVCLLLTAGLVFGAQGEGLIVSDAWVPTADEVGRDIPLLVAIRNDTDAPDALMRVRCPVANFSEKHIVDRGEGAPAMRAISSIPIPAGSTVILKPNEYHVMLLQIREPLTVGGRFNCTLIFQKAGAIETEVEVRRTP
jgi:periplasmic copper chaperone A